MTYINEIAVASVDVLGISRILGQNNGTQTAAHILNNIWINSGNAMYSSPSQSSSSQQIYWKSIKFGDSIYFFGNPNDPIDIQLQNLIVRTGTLIGLGIYNFNYFLRSGIAIGDLEIIQVNIPMHQGNLIDYIYIGSSMDRAHRLEGCQNWIGGAVIGNIDCSSFMTYLTAYNIPIKRWKYPRQYKPTNAINWLEIINQSNLGINIDTTNERIDDITERFGNINRKAWKKIKNTKKFVNNLLNQ